MRAIRHALRAWVTGAVLTAVVGFALGPRAARADDEPAAEGSAGAEGGVEDDEAVEPESVSAHTLADRIPSVTRRVFAKAGRTELAPVLGISVADPFYRHLPVGGTVTYHVLESLAVGIGGEAYVSMRTPVQVSGGIPKEPEYNRPVYAARFDVQWAPLYGKLSLLAERVLHFDTYLAFGGGVVGNKRDGTSMAASVGLGQRYFVSPWMGVRVELRDQIFSIARAESVGAGKDWEHFLTVNVAASFFFPSELTHEAL